MVTFKMKRYGFTRIEAIVVLLILGILAAILFPVLTPRPLTFTRVLIPPLHFKRAKLQTVVQQLDMEMRKKKRHELSEIKWEDEKLKQRQVTLDTQTELPLKEILRRVERSAKVRVDYGGACGTCGGPIGIPIVRDTSKQAS